MVYEHVAYSQKRTPLYRRVTPASTRIVKSSVSIVGVIFCNRLIDLLRRFREQKKAWTHNDANEARGQVSYCRGAAGTPRAVSGYQSDIRRGSVIRAVLYLYRSSS